MIPKDYGFVPGVLLEDPFRNLLAQPDQLKRLFNRIRPTFSITGATNATPIVITTRVSHFLATGDQVTITSVKGNTAANGVFTITKTPAMAANVFSLDGSVGNGTYAAGTGSVVLDQRGETIDRKSLGSLNELITHLQTSGSIAKPIGNIYLGAHASIGGKLALKLWRAQTFDEAAGKISTYENVEETLLPDPAPGLPPLPKRTIQIPATLVGNPPSRPDLFVHLRGCNIGQNGPFMDKWKEALGANAKATASKYEHGVVDLSKKLADAYGSWEYYMYAFTVNRPAPRPVADDPPGKPKPIRSRDELVDAFREARELEGDDTLANRLKFIDGTIVSDGAGDLWSKWIPNKEDVFSNPKRQQLRNPLNEATGNRGTVVVHWGLIAVQDSFPYFIDYAAAALPAPADRMRLFIEHVENNPRFQSPPAHLFPIYVREGYVSVDKFIDGYNWTITGPFSRPGNMRRLIFTGVRHRFILFVPVTSPNPGPDPGATDILYNFFPSVGTSHRAVIQVRSDDPRFFAIR